MATWDDVRSIVLALPGTSEQTYNDRAWWFVRRKSFVYERPLRKTERAALGDAAPDGPVLGAWLADVGVQEALIADDPRVYFVVPYFVGFAGVLVRLNEIEVPELDELITEAWLVRAPKTLAKNYLAASGP
jgi:hypothetical protein